MNDDSKAEDEQSNVVPSPTSTDDADSQQATKSPIPEVAFADDSSSPQMMVDGEMVRCGSPFAPGSVESVLPTPASIESLHDVGSIKYMALGAVTAAVMVLLFDSVAAWWFPAGGLLIAGLGCGLSLFGMISKYRVAAAGLLIAHAVLLLMSYQRILA